MGAIARAIVITAGVSIGSVVTAWASSSMPAPHLAAELRRTGFGVAHIKARDETGLGYGMGYAYAQDNFCVLAETLVTARGERSRFFGPGQVGGPDVESGSIDAPNLQSDFFFKYLNEPPLVAETWRRQSAGVQALVKGYAAGVNRYLRDTGVAGLPPACRDAPWVRPIDELDLMRFERRLAVETSSLAFLRALVDARPPGEPVAAGLAEPRSGDDTRMYSAEWWQARNARFGSNAVALGRDATRNRRGLLLGNPHFPWHGSLRYHQQHLTIPGRLDVMGISMGGLPVIVIGFNRHLAWTHTVNTSAHFTVYELQLDADSPLHYVVDGERRPLRKKTVEVEVRGADGRLERRAHDFWVSSFGPILSAPGRFPWSRTTAYALRDANLDNDRMLEAWRRMNAARSLAQLEAAIVDTVGMPWVNTLAADAAGNVLYANVSSVPNVPASRLEACASAAFDVPKRLARSQMFVLQARRACEWEVDPAAPQPGIFAGRHLPIARRTDFVQNSNDSSWLTNPASPITGFDPIVSTEGYEQNDRTRIGISRIRARLAGTDGRAGAGFDVDQLLEIAFDNRSYYGQLLLDDLRAICRDATPVALDGREVGIAAGCAAMSQWDGYSNLDSRGYPLARSWITELLKMGDRLWRVPFSPEHPVETPRGIRREDPAVLEAVREALARAVTGLQEKGIDASRPWGEIQGARFGERRIPVHGGIDAYNAIVSREDDGLAEVWFGTSYVQAVGFDARGPRALGILTYSQSTNPGSPHFADQGPLFAARRWVALPFTDAQIEADPALAKLVIEE